MIFMFYEDLLTLGTFLEMLKCIVCNSLSIDKLLIVLKTDANLLKYLDLKFHSPMNNYGIVDFKKYMPSIYF